MGSSEQTSPSPARFSPAATTPASTCASGWFRTCAGAAIRSKTWGTPSTASTDYPDWAATVGRTVRAQPGTLGLLVCGSGIGVCIAANKIHGVRAALGFNVEAARLARAHNDANVLCVGARLTTEADAFAIVDAWLTTSFEAGRHQGRVAKIAALEAEEAAR